MKMSLTSILRALPELKYLGLIYLCSHLMLSLHSELSTIGTSISLLICRSLLFPQVSLRARLCLPSAAISPVPGITPTGTQQVSHKQSSNKTMTLKIWGSGISRQHGTQEVKRERDSLAPLGFNLRNISARGDTCPLNHSKREPQPYRVTDSLRTPWASWSRCLVTPPALIARQAL